MARICRELQQDGIPGPRGGPWTMAAVKYVLRNPVYTGSNVYNQLSFKLKRRRIRNGPDTWIRGCYGFAPFIPPDQFTRAQAVLDSRRCRLSDEALIAGLADLRRRIPRLGAQAIDRAADLPTVRVFTRRFGSLTDAYGLAGAPVEGLIAQRARRAALRQARDGLIADVSEALAGARISVQGQGPGRASILIDGHLQIRLVLAVMRTDRGPGERWRFGLSPAPADLLLLVPLRGPGPESGWSLLPAAGLPRGGRGAAAGTGPQRAGAGCLLSGQPCRSSARPRPSPLAEGPPMLMEPQVRSIPVDAIQVLNPRGRNQRVFQDLVESIRVQGLKKPITVRARPEANERPAYDLICGQGRLEAYRVPGKGGSDPCSGPGRRGGEEG